MFNDIPFPAIKKTKNHNYWGVSVCLYIIFILSPLHILQGYNNTNYMLLVTLNTISLNNGCI